MYMGTLEGHFSIIIKIAGDILLKQMLKFSILLR